MNAQQVIEKYQQLSRVIDNVKLPPLVATTYDLLINTETLNQISKVYEKLNEFNPSSGWLDFQSGKQFFTHPPLTVSQDYDMLLNVEVANDKNGSLHIRYNGNGGWIVTTYHYHKGETYIVDKVEHFASFSKRDSAPTTLQYLRFWTVQDTTLGMTPVSACFIGFGGTQ